jgi:phosphatidylserine/phosphatidylglycerophosphate/cardiolipin synthase-like enzyme
VLKADSPLKLTLDSGEFELKGYETFDPYFTKHNSELAKKLNISETDAFILGNLGKYWTKSLMVGRSVYVKENDLVYFKYSYKNKFIYSGYCFQNGVPTSKIAFENRLNSIQKGKFKVLDLDTNKTYKLDDLEIRNLKNFLVLRSSHIYRNKNFTHKHYPQKKNFPKFVLPNILPKLVLNMENIKVIFTDSTSILKPTHQCSSNICKTILTNINNAQSTIDIAIYGYSSVPEIELALKSAINRGVKIRLVYDENSNGYNIYENTSDLVKIIPLHKSDRNSAHAQNIMHDKFYIFDNKTIITGSANLSHTDMSGFNSNSVIVINSPEMAQFYENEFEQMYQGKFHNEKIKNNENNSFNIGNCDMKIYFSPQDKSITNSIIPLIRNAKKYIYLPTFVLTENRVVEELVNAQKRGVEIRIIIDALNASSKYSKHQVLRQNGILVKTENYAGKMHSKSMIIDDEYTIIGSMNFSYSGENKNDENLIVIKNENVAKFYRQFFIYQWNRIDNKWLKFNARAEGKDSIGSCSDGIDNDYDGLIDLDEPACK